MQASIIRETHDLIPKDIKNRFLVCSKPKLSLLKELSPSYTVTPEFLSNTKNTNETIANKNYKISCQLSEPIDPVQLFCTWFVNDEPIISKCNPKYQTCFDQNLNSILMIYNFCQEDCNKRYSCVFITEDGQNAIFVAETNIGFVTSDCLCEILEKTWKVNTEFVTTDCLCDILEKTWKMSIGFVTSDCLCDILKKTCKMNIGFVTSHGLCEIARKHVK